MCVCVILYECRMCVSGVCNSDFRSRRPSVSMIIHVYTPKSWWRLNQRVIFASHSAKLAISIRAPLFVRSVVLFASHSEKLAISLIFASHSEKLAISIRAPFFAKLSAASSIFNSSPVSNWVQLRHPDCCRTSAFSSLPAWERKRR